MRCWRSSEIACPSHRRSIHSETSQLRYMLGSHPQVTHVHTPFFHFLYVARFLAQLFRISFFSIFNSRLDGCRIKEQICKNSFLFLRTEYQKRIRFGDDHRLESRISATKFFNSTRNKIGQFKTRACAGKLLFLPRTLAPVSSG